MTNNCCDSNNSLVGKIDQSKAVNERYGAAALAKEDCLCSPVSFNPELLKVIPSDVIERDYGCGDPTCWVQEGDKVLDLGSGSGKNAFICAQVVGPSGFVIGVDQNEAMISLAQRASKEIANRIGFSNTQFLKCAIEKLDLEQLNNKPLIPDSSIDVVISNCVLNLVNPSKRAALLNNIQRVLRPYGRVAISDVVSNKQVPLELQQDPDLWSGCISGAWQEDDFLKDFISLGFKDVKYVDRAEKPWKVFQGIEFRSVTLTGNL